MRFLPVFLILVLVALGFVASQSSVLLSAFNYPFGTINLGLLLLIPLVIGLVLGVMLGRRFGGRRPAPQAKQHP